MATGHGFKVTWGFSMVRANDIAVIFYGESLQKKKKERVSFSWQQSKFFDTSSTREEVLAFVKKATGAVCVFSETEEDTNEGLGAIKTMVERIAQERAELEAPLERSDEIYQEAIDRMAKALTR